MLAVPKKLDTNDKCLKQLENIKKRVSKGYRPVVRDFAKKLGYDGVHPFVINLINEKMEEKVCG